MSNGSRFALLAAAAVVAVLAFVLLQPADEAQSPVAQTSEATATSTAPPTTAAEQTVEETTTPAPPPEPEVPTLRFAEGEVVGGVEELEFEKGETVEFEVRSDVAEEIHVHGYDKYIDLQPGKTATVRFKGTLEGIFEVELHGIAKPIAELKVSPS